MRCLYIYFDATTFRYIHIQYKNGTISKNENRDAIRIKQIKKHAVI